MKVNSLGINTDLYGGAVAWDPALYHRYSSERNRPFFDLLSQVQAHEPRHVVDLGCGTGELTATLSQRWPDSTITGIDSSAEMLQRSTEVASSGVGFELGSAEDFQADGVDVVVSNALLQWVPTHRDLLIRWARQLNPDGWLAFQVPANFGSPSHVLMRSLAASPAWRDRIGSVLRHDGAVAEPAEYLGLLLDAGLQTSVWQTEYLHLLTGENPVLDWVSGTGLRPILAVLSDSEQLDFRAEYGAALREAYPATPHGTVFGFRRTFVVAHKQRS